MAELNFCLFIFINTVNQNTLRSGKNSILTFRMVYKMDIIPNCQQQIPTGRWNAEKGQKQINWKKTDD